MKYYLTIGNLFIKESNLRFGFPQTTREQSECKIFESMEDVNDYKLRCCLVLNVKIYDKNKKHITNWWDM